MRHGPFLACILIIAPPSTNFNANPFVGIQIGALAATIVTVKSSSPKFQSCTDVFFRLLATTSTYRIFEKDQNEDFYTTWKRNWPTYRWIAMMKTIINDAQYGPRNCLVGTLWRGLESYIRDYYFNLSRIIFKSPPRSRGIVSCSGTR